MSSIKSKIIAAVVAIVAIATILFFTGCTSGSSALSNLHSEPKDSFFSSRLILWRFSNFI